MNLFDETVGRRGSTVRIQEETVGGQVILLAAEDPKVSGYSYRENLGFQVRDERGRLLKGAAERARKIAAEKSMLRVQGKKLADVAAAEDEAAAAEAADDRTVAEVFDLYRAEELPHRNISDVREEEIERSMGVWEGFLGPDFPLADFARGDWERFTRDRMSGALDSDGHVVTDFDARKPVSAATARLDLQGLRQVCRWAATWRIGRREFLLPLDPTAGLEMPEVGKSHRAAYDDAEVEALLGVADKIKWGHGKDESRERAPFRELLVLAADTGRRIGAIVSLRCADWVPDEGSFGTLVWRAENDKMKTDWRSPVTPRVRETLEAWRKENPGIGEAWMFPALESDGHVRVDQAGRWLAEAETEAGVEHVKFRGWHGLRRRWATKRKGLPAQDVAAAGGWRDVQVLQSVYQQTDPDTLERVVLGGAGLRRRS